VRDGPAARITAELEAWPGDQIRAFAALLRRYNAVLNE